MNIKNLAEVSAFITKDSSEIRELLAHRRFIFPSQTAGDVIICGRECGNF